MRCCIASVYRPSERHPHVYSPQPSPSPALSSRRASALVAPVAPGMQMSQVSCSRVADSTMFVGKSKAAPKPKVASKAAPKPKAAPKKAAPAMAGKIAGKKVVKQAPAKRASGGPTGFASQGSAKGKGGVFPWIVNEPGTYAEVPMLSGLFVEKTDELTGWGGDAFSLSKFLYPKGGKGMFDRKM